MITYLQCSDNNRAGTVLNLFLSAWRAYSTPSRIRTDQGTENVDVVRWMLETRELNRKSVITGSSVHNTWIEQLWREVRRVAIHQFIALFNYLEDEGLLDPMDNVHLFALHYVYLGWINKCLSEFSMQYKPPIAIWTQSVSISVVLWRNDEWRALKVIRIIIIIIIIIIIYWVVHTPTLCSSWMNFVCNCLYCVLLYSLVISK